MTRIIPITVALGLAALVGGCGGSGEENDDGGTDIVAEDAGTDVPADAPNDTPADVPADAPADVPADAPADVPADVPADIPADTPTDACTVDPTARESGAYAVDFIEVVAPDIFGTVLPTLTSRIVSADIFVVLATDLERTDTRFGLEVGQSVEYLSPTRRARFCTDELCGNPPNQVTAWSTDIDDCGRFATRAASELVFSLYPPSHAGAATPLRLVNVRVSGRFDPTRDTLTEGVITGAILREQTPLVFPMASISLADLIVAADIDPDYDADADGHFDGWNVEIHFTAEWIEFVR